MLLLTAAEMRALDRETIDVIGVPGVVLMDAAGRAVAELAASLGGDAVVFAGAGNNGGDGFVAARHLANRGIAVDVVLCAPRDKLRGDALTHYLACERSGVRVLDGTTAAGLAASPARAVVIDALFGTGLDRPVEGHLAEAIARVNASPGIKIAVDVPSGLDADRGVPLGVCVRADHTVTFAFAKRGLVTSPGFTFAGRLHVVDIGIPARLAQHARARLLDDAVLAPLRAPRDPLGHKGTHGHLLIVAGSVGKSGASLLCGTAALRLGAGLVTLAAPRALAPVVDGRVLELMTSFYDDPLQIEAALDGKRALAVGPGMPTDAAMRPALARLYSACAARDLPVVIDADGLNHLAAEPALLASRPRAVLTPHPGEAARLVGKTTAEVQHDRIAVAQTLAQQLASTVVLKGARTVIASPDGDVAICPTGGPALGTGGTGDVLTGFVGALLAQGMAPFAAACAAVYLHGAAGDACGARLVAHDVIDAARTLLD
jgi:NAD(P)H-hydrate epimerase